MKADPNGTPVEKARARMGWKTATQAHFAGVPADRRCAQCRFLWWKEGPRSDGGHLITPRCGNVHAGGVDGHATHVNATCNRWSAKP